MSHPPTVRQDADVYSTSDPNVVEVRLRGLRYLASADVQQVRSDPPTAQRLVRMHTHDEPWATVSYHSRSGMPGSRFSTEQAAQRWVSTGGLS